MRTFSRALVALFLCLGLSGCITMTSASAITGARVAVELLELGIQAAGVVGTAKSAIAEKKGIRDKLEELRCQYCAAGGLSNESLEVLIDVACAGGIHENTAAIEVARLRAFRLEACGARGAWLEDPGRV